MRHPVSLFLLGLAAASFSCGDYNSGRPAVAIETRPLRLAVGAWVGDTASREVVVRNQGHRDARLRVDGVPEDFTVEPESFTVPAGEAATVVVSFRPANPGARQVELALRDGDDRVRATLPVDGEGVEAAIEVPESLDFGGVDVGERTAVQVSVHNLAPLPIAAPVIRFEGPGAAAFSAMFPVGGIAANGDALLDVAFAPPTRGPAGATLSISACEPCTPKTIALVGMGQDALVIPTPPSLDFGPISPGGGRTLELTLENRGERTARILEARIGDPFFRLEARSWPIAIEPGESTVVWVTFEPLALGDRQTFVELVGEHVVYAAPVLTGRGGGVILEVDEAVDLGQVPFGWSGYRDTVVRNIADPGPAQLVAARIEGSAAWSLAAPVDGLEVGLRPGTIGLSFSGATVGPADGELVLDTTDPEQRELRIPLRATVVAQPDCELVAMPDPLRFGLVKRGARHERALELRSVGDGPCLVWDLKLAAGSDPDFSVATDGAYFEVPVGGNVRVTVAFAPDAVTGALQRGTVTWRTSNPTAPPGDVEVSGYAADLDLVAVPNPLDFRRVPLDRAPHETVLVRNRGPLAATLAGHAFAAGSSPRYSLLAAPAYPAPLPSAAEVAYDVRYAPDRIAPDRAELEVQVSGQPVPLVVQLLGEGHDGPCGDYCDPPVPVCPGPLTVPVNQSVAIAGSASDPQGDPVTCRWEVASAPEGSSEQPRPPDTCATSFVPDAVGDYELRLTAADDLGNEDSCTTTLHVRPPGGGLWVEMYWERYSNDFDIHLLHGGGGAPELLSSWNQRPWDCYFSNQEAQWDAPGTADDGNLDRDLTTGFGVENIRVDQPSTAHAYHVGLVWYTRRDDTPPTMPVIINVYCWGHPMVNVVTTMTTPPGAGTTKPTIFVGTIRFTESGGCLWTPDGSAAR